MAPVDQCVYTMIIYGFVLKCWTVAEEIPEQNEKMINLFNIVNRIILIVLE